mmetsp:Transcript_2009/g.4133  ORF Transcript_2009/g.4133 Transcript_2009/m.4133 type:complete len:97 (-) Transcript_2009:427-717(-)
MLALARLNASIPWSQPTSAITLGRFPGENSIPSIVESTINLKSGYILLQVRLKDLLFDERISMVRLLISIGSDFDGPPVFVRHSLHLSNLLIFREV